MKKKNIILIGFMGAGKTTLGKALAQKLSWSFLDTDDEIEKEEGKSISEIFESRGEEEFRKLEHNYLKKLRLSNTVLAVGGGMPCFDNNTKLLKEIGHVVYLKREVDELVNNLRNSHERPLLKNLSSEELKEQIIHKLKEREKYYLEANDVIDNNLSLIHI